MGKWLNIRARIVIDVLVLLLIYTSFESVPLLVIMASIFISFEGVHYFAIKKRNEDLSFAYSAIKKMIDTNMADISDEAEEYIGENKDMVDDILISITRLKESKEKLKYENEYIKNVLEMTGDAIATISEEEKFIFVNTSFLKMFKISNSEIISKDIKEIENFNEVGNLVGRDEEIYIKEREFKINNEKKIFSIKTRIMQGNLKDKIVMIRDITEEAKVRDIIFETKKIMAIGDLASGIAHEIRNPLTPIKGLLQIMQQNLSGKSKSFDDYMKIIFSEIDKIDNKIQRINKISDTDTGEKEETELEAVIDEAVDSVLLTEVYKGKNIILNKKYTLNGCKLALNRKKIKEAFENILKNSCEAIEKQGEINISTLINEKEVIVEIADTGKGVSKKIVKNIINPFYTTKDGTKSMGLGLPISYKIITDHFGNLFIDSEEDVGTKVRIVFYI